MSLVGIPLARAGQPAGPYESKDLTVPQSPIDVLILHKLKELHLTPAPPCSDAVFLRRVSLDAIGTLPTRQETIDFLNDRSPKKRSALIDRLLDRNEYADYWAMKWADILRIKAEFPVNLWPNAAQAYHQWVRACLGENRPFDEVAREMLTASGSNFRVPAINFYRAVQGRDAQSLAQMVALVFMGERTERWKPDRLAGMSAFFSQVGYKSTGEWKEEIVFFDQSKMPAGPAVLPDGTPARIAAGEDPRQAFANWLTSRENPALARCVSNRIWAWLFGRGIVNEPDDIRPDNPPVNPELLDYLQRELSSHHYDLKYLMRIILNSQAYQRSSINRANDEWDAVNFAFYPIRRLDAEVLADALCQITGTTEIYSSAIPEPFTFMPQDQRSIALPDGSISSAFLEQFGRPSRDTGQQSERNNRITAAQRLHLLNSSHAQKKLEQGRAFQTLIAGKLNDQIINDLYLTILSRYPSEAELTAARNYQRSSNQPSRTSAVDLGWALINSEEFLYRH